jgi:hypothetical protein
VKRGIGSASRSLDGLDGNASSRQRALRVSKDKGAKPMLNDKQRLEIWRRHHFRCVYCGYDGSRSFKALRYLTVDHLKPKAKDGSDADDNLVTACRACNADKGRDAFDSIEAAQRWLGLYWKYCSRPWFEAHVLAESDPDKWEAKRRRKHTWDCFRAGEAAEQ